MSRVGKQPIAIPAGITINTDGNSITVKGPKGELSKTFAGVVVIKVEGSEINIVRPDDSRQSRSHQGLVRSIVNNLVHGCSTGFVKELEINGVGYRAESKGKFIRFDLGYSHPIFFEVPESVAADVKQTAITLSSPDNELLGQVAAKIRSLRKPEPYKGKGIKYKDERIIRKDGKASG